MMSPLTDQEPLKNRKLLEQYSYDTSKYPVYWIGSSFFTLCIYSLGFVTVRVISSSRYNISYFIFIYVENLIVTLTIWHLQAQE